MTNGIRASLGLACAALLINAPASAVTVSWVDGTGFWDIVANWSPSQLPSSGDDVVINVAGQQTITHRTGSTQIRSIANTGDDIVTVTNGSTLNVQGTGTSTNTGTLRAAGGGSLLRFTAGTLANAGGILDARDGGVVALAQTTVVGGTLTTSNGGVIRALAGSYGTLDSVTLNGTYLVGEGSSNSSSYLRNSLVNNGVLALSSGTVGTLATTLLLGTDVTISGTGSLTMSDAANNQVRGNLGNERLTNAAGHTIQGAGSLGGSGYLSVTNRGTVSATQGTPLIVRMNADGFLNTGILQATGGGLLQLEYSAVTNFEGSSNGVVRALDGSMVELRNNAVITGGILSTSGSGLIRNRANGTLDGVTNNGVFETGDGSSNFTTTLRNVITNNGTLRMNSGVGGNLATGIALGNDVTLAGGGVLTMSNAANNTIYGAPSTTRLTNSATHTISGSGNIGNAQMALTNQGLIVATQTTPLIIQPNSSGVINTGTLRANGGTLDLRGLFTNAGGTLEALDGSSSILQLYGATVAGGTLTSSSGGLLRTAPGQLGRLDGVTLNGTYVAGDGSGNTTTQLVGTITNSGTLALNSSVNGNLATDLVLYQSDVTLAGSGVLTMANAANNRISGFNGNERLTNSATHTISGSGNIGVTAMSLTNQGLIAATQTTPLIIQPNSGGVTNTGTLRASGGTLDLRGMFYNAGGTLDARNGSILQLTNATVAGGTLTTSTNGFMRTTPGNVGRLDGVTLNGTYVAGDGSGNTTTQLVGTITNSGTLAMNSSIGGNLTTDLVLYQSDVTLAGTGTLAMANATNNRISGLNGNEVVTNGSAHTILGAGQILVAVQNAGTVRATGNVGLLANRGIIGPTGTVEVASDGRLTLAAASSAGSLVHNGSAAGSLALGTNSITVHGDYNNANFGLGNAFNARANVTGTGLIAAAGNTAQAITGAGITNGTSATPTLTLGNLRVGSNTFNFQVTNTGSTGPSLRGAIQTSVNGGNITDPRLAVTPQNFGPIAPGGASSNIGLLFNVASAGTIAPLSGQAIHVANNFGNVPAQTISLTLGANAAAYVAAIGQLNTPALNFGTVQVGQSVSQALSISNIATGPAGFVEDLNARFGAATGVGSSLITGTGSISGLLAGATNASGMVVGVNTAAAGTVNGSIPVNFFTAGAVNGSSNGLGESAVGSANFGVVGIIEAIAQVVDRAQPVINNPVINLGSVRINTASPTQFVSVTNQATGNAQAALNASIGAAAPITASGAFNLLAPGGTNSSSLLVGLDTGTAGARSGTATVAFVSDASNVGGCEPNCQVTLASQNVTVQGNVYRLANPTLGTLSVALAARVGDAAPGAGIGVTNSSPDAYTEGLSAAIGTGAAGFNAGGAIANLAAGGTDASTLRVVLDTATAGTFNGTATVTLASTGAGTTGAADLALPDQGVSLTGSVYTPAVAQVANTAIDFGIVHVGDAVAARGLGVTNAAPVTALNDVLRGSLGGATGPFSATGTLGSGLAAGQTDAASLVVGLGTATAGVFNGTAAASFTSHDADLADLGLGTTGITLAGQVNNYADPRFVQNSGAGALTSAGLLYEFSFGTVAPGSGPYEAFLSVQNAAAGPADLLRGSFAFDFGSSQDFGLSGFDAFSGLEAGQGFGGLRIAFDTSLLGLGAFEDTVQLLAVGYNGGGYEGAFSPITLRVRGSVASDATVPEPGTLLLMALGLLSMAAGRARRRRLPGSVGGLHGPC